MAHACKPTLIGFCHLSRHFSVFGLYASSTLHLTECVSVAVVWVAWLGRKRLPTVCARRQSASVQSLGKGEFSFHVKRGQEKAWDLSIAGCSSASVRVERANLEASMTGAERPGSHEFKLDGVGRYTLYGKQVVNDHHGVGELSPCSQHFTAVHSLSPRRTFNCYGFRASGTVRLSSRLSSSCQERGKLEFVGADCKAITLILARTCDRKVFR
eukprot:1772885-Pleurochrysis_carterae.AAC.1